MLNHLHTKATPLDNYKHAKMKAFLKPSGTKCKILTTTSTQWKKEKTIAPSGGSTSMMKILAWLPSLIEWEQDMGKAKDLIWQHH